MSRLKFAAALVATALLNVAISGGAVHAAPDPSAARWGPARLADQIELKAEETSFARLEAFGRDAMRLRGRARLDRLHHVAWVFLNQSEFGKFDTWNAVLRKQAAADKDARYLSVAAVNALRSRYDQGDAAIATKIEAAAANETDWYARAHAMRTAAYVRVRQDQTGSALKMLSEADAMIPRGDPYTGPARGGVWEIEGLALMDLQDLEGSALAFGRSQFEFAPSDYPRPDFDGLYNMASLAAKLGQHKLADRLYSGHHRLAIRSDLPNLHIWDRNLCAMVAEARQASADVLKCFEGLSPGLKEAGFLSTRILTSRALAHARLGHAGPAAQDLRALKTLKASKAFEDAAFAPLPLIEAEVLRAQGRTAEGFIALRGYWDQRAITDAKRSSAGIRQLTAEMEKQLGVRKSQLATIRRNQALQQDVIRTQRLVVFLGGVLGASILALLLWQWRVAGQLRLARRNADAANRAKSEFLANMSHEIRTPLNGVVAVADLLALSKLEPKEREMVQIIRASGDTLQRLLSDILDLSRVESGQITLETAPFQAGDMVRSVAALSALRCDEKGVAFKVEIAPELDGPVIGDLVRVRQILTNLLSNAVKFTDKGKITLIAERTPAGLARFTVRDTGVGFDPSNKAQVLGRFQQADSSITRRFGGTGLGLAISRQLAELMGGDFDCDSVPGKGSTFWFEIPLEATTITAALAGLDPVDTADDRELRILLADDHPTNRKVVELMFSNGGADLYSVENGREAVDAFGAGTFDVILMDMQMPVMDGLTAVREIRRLEAEGNLRATPIVMLTANALREHVADAAAAGANRHLAKPFTAAALFETVELALADGARGDGEILAA